MPDGVEQRILLRDLICRDFSVVKKKKPGLSDLLLPVSLPRPVQLKSRLQSWSGTSSGEQMSWSRPPADTF